MWTVLGIQAEIPRQSKDRVGSRGGGAPEKEKETMMCISDCVASPLNAHVEVLISNVTGFRNGNFRWIIKLKTRWNPSQVEEEVLQLASLPRCACVYNGKDRVGQTRPLSTRGPRQKITPQFLLLLLLDSTGVPQNTNCLRHSVLSCLGGQAKGKSQNPETFSSFRKQEMEGDITKWLGLNGRVTFPDTLLVSGRGASRPVSVLEDTEQMSQRYWYLTCFRPISYHETNWIILRKEKSEKVFDF